MTSGAGLDHTCSQLMWGGVKGMERGVGRKFGRTEAALAGKEGWIKNDFQHNPFHKHFGNTTGRGLKI